MKLSKNFLEHSKELLKERGLKLTKPRLLLLEFLAKERSALTPYQMRDMLAEQSMKSDVVTLYRILEELEKIGLVHKIASLGKFIRCEQEDSCDDHEGHHGGADCHHYLICENCGSVEEVVGADADFDGLEKLEVAIKKSKGFAVKRHTLEFWGLCAKCLKKSKK